MVTRAVFHTCDDVRVNLMQHTYRVIGPLRDLRELGPCRQHAFVDGPEWISDSMRNGQATARIRHSFCAVRGIAVMVGGDVGNECRLSGARCRSDACGR